MRIGKQPADFNVKAVCEEYERQMSRGTLYDITIASDGERKDINSIHDLNMRLVQNCVQFKYLLDGEEAAFAGFNEHGKIVWFADNSCTPKVKNDDLVTLAMERGAPVERTVGDDHFIAVPMFENSEGDHYFFGVVSVRRSAKKLPLTEWQWLRCVYITLKWYWAVKVAIREYPGTIAAHPIPVDHVSHTGSWRDGLCMLTRANLLQMAEKYGVDSLEKAKWWLDQVIAQIGLSDSRQMHPDELLQSLEKSLSKKETNEISRSASTTAQQLTQTASMSEWNDTSEEILNSMGAIFEQTPAVYFVMVNHGVDPEVESYGPDLFTIQHSTAAPIPETQECLAMEVLVRWVGLIGNAIYSDGHDDDMIIKLVRQGTTQKKPLFAIPVFGWSKTPVLFGSTDATSLHGVFVGFRRESAPQPSVAAWLTWIYTTQHMLSPIATAALCRRLVYHPIDVERNIAKARQTPEKMLFPWGTFRSVRRIE